MISVSTLRNLEKLSLKRDKASLDIKFLLTCTRLSVVPKFINFNLQYTNHNDERAIQRRPLQSAINKRRYEKQKLEKELGRLKTNVRSLVMGIDWYILWRSIDNNVCKKRKKILPTQEKKLKNLTFNIVILFTCDEIVKNLSSFEFSTEELELLKYDLSHSIPPKQLRKTEVFTTFDMIHRFLRSKLSSNQFENALKTNILYLANNYYSNYRPLLNTLKKHKILEKLRRNKDIVITRPDKGNGFVVMDRVIYNQQMYALLSDKNKFKKLSEDPAKFRERQLQRYLRELKKKQFLDDATYDHI